MLVAALASALLGAPESGAAQFDSGTAGTAGALGKARTVTLVTGDRVTLDATGQVTGVQPGKGREGTAFRIARSADRTYVVPRDAERLLANGTADRRLFDVTQLVKWGYDDAARPDLPLIVRYAKGRTLAPSALSAAGARVSRDLPSLNGDALKARKSKGANLWETLTGSGGGRERGAGRRRPGREDLARWEGRVGPRTRAPRRSVPPRPGRRGTTARASRSPCWTPELTARTRT